MYWERHRRWEVPFVISSIANKKVWVSHGNKEKQFNCTQVVPNPEEVAGCDLSHLLDGFKSFNTGVIPGVDLTEVLQNAIKRNSSPAFDFPKAKELCDFLYKRPFEVVCEGDVPEDTNVFRGIFFHGDQ